jgi:hypothetical protein
MRGKRQTTLNLIEKRYAEGRGQGRGAAYKPWLYIQDVPSQGLATRIRGWKTKREHHLLSKLELLFFFLLEWSAAIIDIREQYPLDLSETLVIAEQLGIRHPRDPKTQHPIVMTTDFLLTIPASLGIGENARTIKYAQALSSIRAMEKLEIERLYWKRRNIDWGIVTDKEIDPTMASNIKWVHPYKDVSSLTPLTATKVNQIEDVLTPKIRNQCVPLRNITNGCDKQLGLHQGSSLSVVKHLIATRKIEVRMDIPIHVGKSLAIIPN